MNWVRTLHSSTSSEAVNKYLTPVVAMFCGYEIIAITSGRVPTLSALDQRYHFLGPLLVGGLVAHLYGSSLARFRQRGA